MKTAAWLVTSALVLATFGGCSRSTQSEAEPAARTAEKNDRAADGGGSGKTSVLEQAFPGKVAPRGNQENMLEPERVGLVTGALVTSENLLLFIQSLKLEGAPEFTTWKLTPVPAVASPELEPSRAFELWKKLRARLGDGFQPIALEAGFFRSFEAASIDVYLPAISALKSGSAEAFFAGREQELGAPKIGKSTVSPGPPPAPRFLEDPKTRLVVVVLQSEAARVPIYLRFDKGASSAEHGLVYQDWKRRFGAKLVYLDATGLEFLADRLPDRPEDLRNLLRQQFLYRREGPSFAPGWSFSWE